MKQLKDLDLIEFDSLKQSGMLWEFYPDAPEFYWELKKQTFSDLVSEIALKKIADKAKSAARKEYSADLEYKFKPFACKECADTGWIQEAGMFSKSLRCECKGRKKQ